jgi:hypothetical protein
VPTISHMHKSALTSPIFAHATPENVVPKSIPTTTLFSDEGSPAILIDQSQMKSSNDLVGLGCGKCERSSLGKPSQWPHLDAFSCAKRVQGCLKRVLPSLNSSVCKFRDVVTEFAITQHGPAVITLTLERHLTFPVIDERKKANYGGRSNFRHG